MLGMVPLIAEENHQKVSTQGVWTIRIRSCSACARLDVCQSDSYAQAAAHPDRLDMSPCCNHWSLCICYVW